MINTAFLLAGGKGTRLSHITKHIQKVMIPINQKPIIQHIMEWYAKYGVRNFILGVGYKKEQVKEYFGDGSKFGFNINYVEEEEPLGTGGSLKLAQDKLKSTFMFGNGDVLSKFNLNEMITIHEKEKPLVTMALKAVDDPWRFGIARLEGNKMIDFIEKPEKGTEPTNLANAGVQVMEPEVLDLIPENKFCSYEKEIFPPLVKKSKACGYEVKSQWIDVGVAESLELARKTW